MHEAARVNITPGEALAKGLSFSVLRRVLLLALAAILVGAGFAAGVLTHKYRVAIRSRLRSMQSSPIVQTNLYSVRVEKQSIPGSGRDGAIEVLGDGLLLVNRDGRTWYVTKERALRPLALQVPINLAEFASDPYNESTTNQDRFSVKGILVQELGPRIRIGAAHLYWYRERRCNVLRVSVTETTVDSLLSGATGGGSWKTLFESRPCRELNSAPDGRSRHVTLGAGGRLAALPDGRLILSVGEFSAEYTAENGATDANDSYGKTIVIDPATSRAVTFTRGHRNQQGITVGPNGEVWGAEHGSRGGDELNLLVAGKDYGAPNVTYGTQYEMKVWPRNPRQGRHEGFEKPVFAWVPSIAPSQLIVLRGQAFPYWAGDLMVSSLASLTLYRVRVEDGRVIFVEPISIGHRIRDLVEMPNGTIALKTDDDLLVYLSNLAATSTAQLSPVQQGELLAGQCRSCHTMEPTAPAGIGPNLWGVVGRAVASRPGYQYSEALRRAGGHWTQERLRAFLSDPGTFAPGNRMQTTTKYSAAELHNLIIYLETLR
jgi:cytochrome c2